MQNICTILYIDSYTENNLNIDDLQSAKPLSKDVTGHTQTSHGLPLNVGHEARGHHKDAAPGEETSGADADNTTPKQMAADDSNTQDFMSDGTVLTLFITLATTS